MQTSGQPLADAGPGGLVLFPLFSLPERGVLGPSMTCPGPGPCSRGTALLSLILVSPLLLHLLSGHFHDTYPVPEVPEGGWTRHHQRGDHQGCRGAGRDRPCRDGAAQRPDPLVPGPEPYPDSGMVMVACPGPGGGIPSVFIARCREGSSS